jgi:hypothetical protein
MERPSGHIIFHLPNHGWEVKSGIHLPSGTPIQNMPMHMIVTVVIAKPVAILLILKPQTLIFRWVNS